MRVKKNIKISLTFIFIVVILIGGIVLFHRIINNKNVYQIDLYSHIPNDVSSVLQINSQKDNKHILPYVSNFENIITLIEKSINYPVLIVQKDSVRCIVARLTNEQQNSVMNTLANKFTTFSPKRQEYKHTKLYFYPINNNRFFICTFFQNIFIGSYNLHLLEEFIDVNKNAKSISDILSVDKINTHYSANLILNADSLDYTVYDLDFIDKELRMTISDSNSDTVNSIINDSDILRINQPDYSIMPDSVISYQIINKYPINNPIARYLNLPAYIFYTKNNTISPIYAIKCKESKFLIYKELNRLNEKFREKRFDTTDLYLSHRIYTTSKQMGQNIFNLKGVTYLTFYKNYLLFSKNKNNLIDYLAHNGNYVQTNSLHSDKELLLNIYSLFFSNNLKMSHPNYFNPNNPISEFYNNQAYFVTRIENRRKIQEVIF